MGGGTSQAAPIWAALTPLMNQYLIANGGHAVGAVNPLLYRIASGAAAPGFRDVSLGANAVDTATPGYDLVTGLGPPNIDSLVRNVLDIQEVSNERPRRVDEVRGGCPVCRDRRSGRRVLRFCGSQLSTQRGDGPPWLRLRAFSAAPGENVLPPRSSARCSRIWAPTSRRPFRIALVVLLFALVVFAVLRWQAPLVAVSALGLPLLFQLYLWRVDGYADLPPRALLVSAALPSGSVSAGRG